MVVRFLIRSLSIFAFLFPLLGSTDLWLEFEGGEGPAAGKHIVLISGDEEYRSEEALPQLAKILSKRHGFKTTVLFAIDPTLEIIQPNVSNNIPGLESLKTADLMILFTRFRALPEDQMQQIDRFLQEGKPVIGIRTSTHAFKFEEGDPWNHYSNGYTGSQGEWTGGFGRLVLGEHWISHHGEHKHQSTRGLIPKEAANHPILRGVRDGDIWGPSDVYTVRLPLPGDSRPLVLGQVLDRRGDFNEEDPFYGMAQTDPPAAEKNDPMMPIAWTKSYELPNGQRGIAFTSTIGASTDLVTEGTRRLLINAVFWCLGLGDRIPETGTNVDLVGAYDPTAFEFRDDSYWLEKKLRPADFVGEDDR